MDVLYDFACAFLEKNKISADMDFDGENSNIGKLGVTLVTRSENFQIEFFSVPPNYIVPAHRHPNVDSIEVYVDGQLKFSHRGDFVFVAKETITSAPDPSYRWRMLRIRPEDRHGAVTGPQGARFLSIQHWLNGVAPHSVALDYDGPVMDMEHMRSVKTGHPEARRQEDLHEQDAV